MLQPSLLKRRHGFKLVVIVYDVGSASAATICAAAARAYDLLFLCDCALKYVKETYSSIAQFAPTLDVTGHTESDITQVLRELAPDGIVTFSEYRLAQVSRYAVALGLPGHSGEVIENLTDKYQQRQALVRAGVPSTKSVIMGDSPQQAVAQTGLPAVLKPRNGAGSLHTYLIHSVEELSEKVQQLHASGEYVLEAYLQGNPDAAGEGWGDYVSVESLHLPGHTQQVCITGKFPLVSAFRETGMVIPHTLSPSLEEAIFTLERAAINALGIEQGITHTEIKLTPDGPKIIEINGRLGGFLPDIIKRNSGTNLVLAALDLSVGTFPRVNPVNKERVAYQFFITPQAGVCGKFMHLAGVDHIASLPGVVHVEQRIRPGDLVDWRTGTQSLMAIVYGSSPDHRDVMNTVNEVRNLCNAQFMLDDARQ